MSLRSSFPTRDFLDDGFSITATEPWFKVKVQLIQQYLYSFVTNAASRVDEIIWVDLCAGSGLMSLGHQREVFAGASFEALKSTLPVSKWVLCETDADQVKALRIRVNKHFRDKNVLVVDAEGDELAEKLKLFIPPFKSSHKVAVCCLVDPFSLDVPFSLLSKLAAMGYSFIMPFTFDLNDRHNVLFYQTEKKEVLKRFCGGDVSRLQNSQHNLHFYKNLVKIFQQNMLMQGQTVALSVHKLQSQLMDLPMYYIGYFSGQISPKLIHRDMQGVEYQQTELFQAI